jgi:hypothetical protein
MPVARAWLALATETRDRVAAAIRWFERFSRPQASRLFEHRVRGGVRSTGVRAHAERVPRTAFLGLDTLPSLGVVVIGLGVLTRDLLLALLGALLGAIGVATILAIGNLVLEAAQHVL